MNLIVLALLVAAWIYLLWVLTRAELHFWKFLAGSLGSFALMMTYLRPLITQPLARGVSAMAGVLGSVTGAFTAYFKYGILFIPVGTGSMTLRIDFECSGVIEMMAFVCLLAFFRVYQNHEKLLVGVVGLTYIMVANVLRVTMICMALHFFGVQAYYITHTFVGRLFFYALTIFLYFYVFTRPQVSRMKVGGFRYGHS